MMNKCCSTIIDKYLTSHNNKLKVEFDNTGQIYVPDIHSNIEAMNTTFMIKIHLGDVNKFFLCHN